MHRNTIFTLANHTWVDVLTKALPLVMDTPTADSDKPTNLELEQTRLETREVGYDEVRNLMKTTIKIKETRWGETRILD